MRTRYLAPAAIGALLVAPLAACSSSGNGGSNDAAPVSPTPSSSSPSSTVAAGGADALQRLLPTAAELPVPFRDTYVVNPDGAANNPPMAGLESAPAGCTLQGDLDKQILANLGSAAGFRAVSVQPLNGSLAEGTSTAYGSILDKAVDVEAEAARATGECGTTRVGSGEWRTETVPVPPGVSADRLAAAVRTSTPAYPGAPAQHQFIAWAQVKGRTLLIRVTAPSPDRTAFDAVVTAAVRKASA